MTRIAYFVHNLADAAVARRVTMLRAGGADVVVAGFCRDPHPPETVAGVAAIPLGRTHDAAFGQRLRQVIGHLARTQDIVRAARGADVIVARNLEMLALARRAQAACGTPRLVYESLDIHRSLLGTGPGSRAMRAVERGLASRCDLLLTSSPAFLREYFLPRQRLQIPALLVENKLLELDGGPAARAVEAPAGPPWTIGWFGNLRCRRTLATLSDLAGRAGGAIEVVIAGKASPAEFPDFERQVQQPHMRYLGPYRAEDLPALYARCHFAWAIDWFEDGLNSTWLLPNRLYEASIFGAVPIALREVETGRWLARHGTGLLLDRGDEAGQVLAQLLELRPDGFRTMAEAVRGIRRDELVAGAEDCRRLVREIAG